MATQKMAIKKMKKKKNYTRKIFGIILACLLIIGHAQTINSEKGNTMYEFQIPKAGDIKPKGWIKEQLHRDLTEGYIGRFDEVHKTVTHNVFVKQNRRSTKQYRIIKEWWSGEHEGYWKDAIVRMAFLTGNQQYIDQSKEWMEELIENAGKNGYIGIYEECDAPTCRFKHKKGNGELWATSRILMAMLAYHEYTGDEKVLAAAEKASKLIMEQYSDRNYFSKTSKGGGVSHGVGFFENLEWLFRLTGDESYNDFALKLYEDFNQGPVRDDDLKLQLLLDEDRKYKKHGAHIAEGMFIPTYIAHLNKDSVYKEAVENSLEKLYYHITPGGAMRCDEFIKNKQGTADERYEYCGIAEIISPLLRMLTMTGKLELADRVETMTFNAGQGSRFPTLTALSYLTSDNRIKLNHNEIGKRESYDAAHRAAACCVLNGGRLMPYYVEGMWMKDAKNGGIMALLYGPSEITTSLKGQEINIQEDTDYPFSDKATFTMSTSPPLEFNLMLRKPHGAGNMKINAPKGAKVEEVGDYYTVAKKWENGDVVEVDFHFDVEKIPQPSSKTVPGGGYYLKRGPIVFALPFKHQIDTVKEYYDSGFYRYKIKAKDKDNWKLKIDEKSGFTYSPMKEANYLRPFDKVAVKLEGELVDKKGNKVPVTLVPEGNTIFRRITFPVVKNQQK